jgi:adenine-specific DNA-methyltransferase
MYLWTHRRGRAILVSSPSPAAAGDGAAIPRTRPERGPFRVPEVVTSMPMARDLEGVPLTERAAALQRRHEAAMSVDARKERGQVFTPPGIARFMAGLFTRLSDRFRLLDAGAGAGVLSSAVCERLLALRSPRRIEIHLYETDRTLLPLLEVNMRHCREAMLAAGRELRYTIHDEDFILGTRGRPDQRMLFDEGGAEHDFDAAITNPPYFKIGADSPHALVMGEAFRGNTNIYMLFLARAAELLRPGGEMVAITPRSFCNGLYFRNFRRWFFARMGLRHVHLFECRRSTFDDVLQESLITLTNRLGTPPDSTTITTSPGRDIPARPEVLALPASRVLDDSAGDMVVRIPSSSQELSILEAVEAWPDRFADLGLAVSTGPVVLFRAREYLLSEPDATGTAPLLEPHNVRPFETVWPVERRGKPTAFRVCRDSLKHLVPTRNYVLLRRFSAKEERRRLTASWFLRGPESPPYLALENHLNYVYHAERELNADEVRGLTALFNSALLDRSFRIMSGNTQVNATEIRTMRFPSLDRAAAIGARVRDFRDYPPAEVERVVLEELGINGRLRAYLMEAAS